MDKRTCIFTLNKIIVNKKASIHKFQTVLTQS